MGAGLVVVPGKGHTRAPLAQRRWRVWGVLRVCRGRITCTEVWTEKTGAAWAFREAVEARGAPTKETRITADMVYGGFEDFRSWEFGMPSGRRLGRRGEGRASSLSVSV